MEIITYSGVFFTVREKFFVERSLEMLSPDVMDSYRHRVMNPMTILGEFYYLLCKFEKKKIKHFSPTIEKIVEELKGIFAREKELIYPHFSKEYFISTINTVSKDNYSKAKVLTKAILSSNNSCYYRVVVEKIEATISQKSTNPDDIYNDFREIDRLTSYLITGLIDKGFSKNYLRTVINSSFIRKAKPSFKKCFGVFHFLSKKRKNQYLVYFKAEFPVEIRKNLTSNSSKIKILQELPRLNIRVKPNENPSSFFKNEANKNLYLRIEVSAHDSISGVTFAKRELQHFLDLIHLGFSTNQFMIKENVLILNADENSTFSDYWYRNYENELDGKIKGGIALFELFSQRFTDIQRAKAVKSESHEKLISALRYIGTESVEIEHKFLNYWIGLEYLFSNTNDPASTIERVKKYLCAIQANIFIKRLIVDYHKSIMRLKATEINGFDPENYGYLLLEETYQEIFDKYLLQYPLLAFRAKRFLYTFFHEPTGKERSRILQLLTRHKDGLRQHLTRIYRVRNEIVHEAAIDLKTDIYTLTSNLKHYLLVSLDIILEALANEKNGIRTIDELLILQESISENMLRNRKLGLKQIIALDLYTKIL